MRPAHRPQYIAMSCRRLFLGWLLPSRARLRFTGGADDTAPHRRVNFVSAEVRDELSVFLTASDRTAEEIGEHFRRIASPELLPSDSLLPHLKCSPPASGAGVSDEVGEHGYT
jgi:hypothetical protein